MNKQRENITHGGLLSQDECSALRGLAIIGIVLHNYCHWLAPIVKENEYTFNADNVGRMVRAALSPDANLPAHLLSFFGHYGVPIFLFLSAYGLVMKYESEKESRLEADDDSQAHSVRHRPSAFSSHLSFLKRHFVKLFRMMIVGYVAFLMVDAVTPGTFHYTVVGVVAQLGLFNNLLPTPDKMIWPGPYWFFGLMMQLYLVYRLLLYRRHWMFTVALVVVCCAVQMICDPTSETLNYLRYNFIGGMLPFGAGLLYARFGKNLSPIATATVFNVSLIAIVMFSGFFMTWFFVPLFVCTCAVSLAKILPRTLLRPLAWVGGISAPLFVCHPITRKIFIPMSRHGDIYTGLLLYVVTSLVVALLFRFVFEKINKKPQTRHKA